MANTSMKIRSPSLPPWPDVEPSSCNFNSSGQIHIDDDNEKENLQKKGEEQEQ